MHDGLKIGHVDHLRARTAAIAAANPRQAHRFYGLPKRYAGKVDMMAPPRSQPIVIRKPPARHNGRPPITRIIAQNKSNVRRIIAMVASAFGLEDEMLHRRGNAYNPARARYAVYKMLREHLGWSYPIMAAVFGVDPSSARDGYIKANAAYANDSWWRQCYEVAHGAFQLAATDNSTGEAQ